MDVLRFIKAVLSLAIAFFVILMAIGFVVAQTPRQESTQGRPQEKSLPDFLIQKMVSLDIDPAAPIFMRAFKEENQLEVWKQARNGDYKLLWSYEICNWSGKLGPKFREGDRQTPEGFYTVTPTQMNPNSNYHLSFNIGFPNNYDRINGRTGSYLMVHGNCLSVGCFAMTDPAIEQIYAFAREAFNQGQKSFAFHAYPFRMTGANMARYAMDANMPFWNSLKTGYDIFEITHRPPRIEICGKTYVAVPSDNQMGNDAICQQKDDGLIARLDPDYHDRNMFDFIHGLIEPDEKSPLPTIAVMK